MIGVTLGTIAARTGGRLATVTLAAVGNGWHVQVAGQLAVANPPVAISALDHAVCFVIETAMRKPLAVFMPMRFASFLVGKHSRVDTRRQKPGLLAVALLASRGVAITAPTRLLKNRAVDFSHLLVDPGELFFRYGSLLAGAAGDRPRWLICLTQARITLNELRQTVTQRPTNDVRRFVRGGSLGKRSQGHPHLRISGRLGYLYRQWMTRAAVLLEVDWLHEAPRVVGFVAIAALQHLSAGLNFTLLPALQIHLSPVEGEHSIGLQVFVVIEADCAGIGRFRAIP